MRNGSLSSQDIRLIRQPSYAATAVTHTDLQDVPGALPRREDLWQTAGPVEASAFSATCQVRHRSATSCRRRRVCDGIRPPCFHGSPVGHRETGRDFLTILGPNDGKRVSASHPRHRARQARPTGNRHRRVVRQACMARTLRPRPAIRTFSARSSRASIQ